MTMGNVIPIIEPTENKDCLTDMQESRLIPADLKEGHLEEIDNNEGENETLMPLIEGVSAQSTNLGNVMTSEI